MNPVRIGSRSSPLALWQAHHIQSLLRPLTGPRGVELVLIETTGDQIRDRPLSQIGGDGLFTKEIQTALLDDRIDVAVHSLKDLPTLPVPGLLLAAVPARGPIGDALVSQRWTAFDQLPPAARVGTSSLRRSSQLLHRRPDLIVSMLRGNVETRLRKLEEEGFDAILLAEAGLRRLGLDERITEILDRSWMLPAVGQGALGLECRHNDKATQELLAPLSDEPTFAAVRAERALLRQLGGGCLVPLGALGEVEAGRLHLRGCVLSADGKQRVEGQQTGSVDQAETLGEALARHLIEQGAAELLHRGG